MARQMLLPVFGGLLIGMSCSAAARSQTEGRPLYPHEPRSHTILDGGNGISWTVSVPSEVTVHDSIWVESSMRHRGRQALAFLVRDGMLPRAFLSREGAPPVEKLPEGSAGAANLYYDKWAQDEETFHRFQVDLRAVFGRLAPGDYKLLFVWPRTRYEIQGRKDGSALDMKSPVAEFRVVATTLAEASRQLHESYGPYFWIAPNHKNVEAVPETPLTVTFTNKTKTNQPVRFPVLPRRGATEQAAARVSESVVMVFKWSGREWYVPPVTKSEEPPFQATEDLAFHTVAPGESTELIPSDAWLAHGDGIYHYLLHVQLGAPDTPGAWAATVVSEPFQVRMVRRD